eukprot:m.116158 g.116158  ORF g.116158 m.116158 type:complete len:216 (-) comp14225_c0_seq9:1659-2306(-)
MTLYDWLQFTMTFSIIVLVVNAVQLHAIQKPNILLLFPDELRYDWGGVVNNPYFNHQELPLNTPNFDSLATSGTRFTTAVVAAPVCAPSRACLAAGREYDAAGQGQNGASVAPSNDNDFDVEEIKTFYKAIQEAGYWTMITGRDDLTKRTGPGLNGSYHAEALGFSDQERCAGSVDVTWGEVALVMKSFVGLELYIVPRNGQWGRAVFRSQFKPI